MNESEEQETIYATWAADAENWKAAQDAWKQYLDELIENVQQRTRERRGYIALMGEENTIWLGMLVHYVATNDERDPEQHYAAIVSHIWHDDVVRLHVFIEDSVQVVQQVGMSESFAGNSWHYCHDCSM